MRRASSHTDGSRSSSPPPRLVTRHLICECSAYNRFGFGGFCAFQGATALVYNGFVDVRRASLGFGAEGLKMQG